MTALLDKSVQYLNDFLYSTQLKPPSQWGLFATLSLGLLHGDFGLAQLVLKELQPMKDDPDVLYHYSVLLSLTYLLQVILYTCNISFH